MTWAPWSPTWTRKNLLGHLAAISDWIVFTDERDEHNNLTRRWYALFRHLGEDQVWFWPVLSQSFLASPTGSNQTHTSDATWNNSNNSIETIGAGASGGALARQVGKATGGGAGAYAKITNFSFATPGTTTATYQIGTGGTSVTANSATPVNGNNGGNTWFNNTVFATGATNAQCAAAGGNAGSASTAAAILNGGTGGSTGFGTTINAGGRGGNYTGVTNVRCATGGGGAAGPTSTGNAGVDTATSLTATNGGSADNGGTGAGIAGTSSTANGAIAGAGGNGTEFDATPHGCGGGGGAHTASSTSTPSGGGAGGNYGGGGGAGSNQQSSASVETSGAGGPGLIVLTWTPALGSLIFDPVPFQHMMVR